jgi:hypothetical protein
MGHDEDKIVLAILEELLLRQITNTNIKIVQSNSTRALTDAFPPG